MKKIIWILTIIILLFNTSSFAAVFNISNTGEFRHALKNAAVNGEDDTIIISAGIYKTTDDGLGTFQFTDIELHDLTIKAKDGLTQDDVILDGDNTHRVLILASSMNSNFTVRGISIVKGNGDKGGGIYSYNNLIIDNSNISDNYASESGAGIFSNGLLTVNNSSISNNTAGYIYNIFCYGDGGGIYMTEKEYIFVDIKQSSIVNNYAGCNGGGIYAAVFFMSENGNSIKVNITNSTLSNNIADSFSGGGIYANLSMIQPDTVSSINIDIVNSLISKNISFFNGGGVYANTSFNKGKIAVTAVNSTIFDNISEFSGGGIYGEGLFINNIFHNNSADIFFTGDSRLYNNYVDYSKLENGTVNEVIKENNVQPYQGSPIFIDADLRIGACSITVDAGLDPFSQTFEDLFSDIDILTTVQDVLNADKDGNQRISGDAIDLGAYEFASSSLNYSPYDTDQDFVLGDFELLNAIDEWAAGTLEDFALLDLIDFWAAGCYHWDVSSCSYKAGC